jgi:hypothetical protein
MSPGNGKPDLVVTLDPLEIAPDPAEVLRYLGYPSGAAVNSGVTERVLRAIEDSRARVRPRGVYSLYSIVHQDRRSLTLAGGVAFTGSIGEYLGGAQRAAVFVATAGPEVLSMAEETLRRRDALGGLIYNAIGSQLAEAVVERIVDDLRKRAGPHESLTLRYSPGYCGISLAQQQTLFGLVDAGRIGVELLPTLIMKPVKSVSGLLGIGPKNAIAEYGNPCDRCPLLDCRMRR